MRADAKRLTAIWGCVLLAEATVRIGLSFLVPPGVLVLISPLLAAASFGPLALWTLRRRARSAKSQATLTATA